MVLYTYAGSLTMVYDKMCQWQQLDEVNVEVWDRKNAGLYQLELAIMLTKKYDDYIWQL